LRWEERRASSIACRSLVRALDILREVKGDDAERNDDDHVFAAQREGTPLSNMALLMMLRRMKREDITAHGFRLSFSDWASEVSSFSGELRETALAHAIQNKAERAYRRGDALEKRREMMDSWACFCEPAVACDAGQARDESAARG
jgi:integrase